MEDAPFELTDTLLKNMAAARVDHDHVMNLSQIYHCVLIILINRKQQSIHLIFLMMVFGLSLVMIFLSTFMMFFKESKCF